MRMKLRRNTVGVLLGALGLNVFMFFYIVQPIVQSPTNSSEGGGASNGYQRGVYINEYLTIARTVPEVTNSNVCRGVYWDRKNPIFLVTFVLTRPNSFDQRLLIRKTWASVREYKNLKIVTIFVMGKSRQYPQFLLEHEATQYGDMLQFDYEDTYVNLTTKTFSAMNWITESCPTVKYIVKADDDTVTFPKNLVDYLERGDIKPKKFLLTGAVSAWATPIRRLDAEKHLHMAKWETNYKLYPYRYYPPYVVGPAIVMSAEFVKLALNIAVDKKSPHWPPPISPDDTYIGICAHAANVTSVPANKMFIMESKYRSYCDISPNPINIHGYTVIDRMRIWQESQVECPTRSTASSSAKPRQ